MADAEPLIPPRLRDAGRTREQILHAGQKLFAQKGYSTTGVREIATEAGVNSALVRRYFGSKLGLLEAALEEILQIQPIVAGKRAEFGRRAASQLLQADAVPNPVAMMALAMADPAARELCRDLLHRVVILPLAEWLGGNDALGRAARLNLLWTGFITARYLLPLEPLSDEHVGSTRAWLERTTQAIADED